MREMSRWGRRRERRGASSEGDRRRDGEGDDHSEFRLGRLPVQAQVAFATGVPWHNILDEAIAGGVRDPGALADLMFFLQHRDRVVGGVGRPIDPKEDGFHALRAEWSLHRAIAARRLRPSAPCSVFLPEHPSASYEDRVDAATTGHARLFVHGRSAGAAGLGDHTGGLDDLQAEVESLGAGDTIYIAAVQFHPSCTSLTARGAGDTWADLLVRQAEAGVAIRIVLGEPPGAHAPSSLEDCARIAERLTATARDRFQVVASTHPAKVFDPRKLLDPRTRESPFVEVGAHHQRLVVIRKGESTIAYCGPELSPSQAPPSWSARPVWHDVHVRLDGLVAHDLECELVERWNREKERSATPALHGAPPPEALAVRDPARSAAAPARNPHAIQIQRTVSVGIEAADIRRDDIWLGYFQLIGAATQFLYLENQCLHEPRLADAIARQAEAEPALVVIAVASSEPEESPSPLAALGPAPHEFFARLAAAIPAARLGLYTMSGRRVHGNLILADDRALSIGSASATPRSFFLDTELNLMIDAPPAVQDLRHRLWAHDLAVPVAAVARWRVADFVACWDAIARDNGARPLDQRVGEGIVPFDPRVKPGRTSGLSG